MKIGLIFISSGLMGLNASAYKLYKGTELIIPRFENAEWNCYLIYFGFMSAVINLYGAILYYADADVKMKRYVRTGLYYFFVWEVIMFLKFVISAVCLFFAYSATGELFDVGSSSTLCWLFDCRVN